MIVNNSNWTYELLIDSNKVLGDEATITDIIIKMDVNQIPSVELTLSSHEIQEYITKFTNADYTLVIKVLDDKLEFNVGNYDIRVLDNEIIKLTGLLCKVDDFKTIRSRYLGDDLPSAVSSLDFKSTITGIDKITGGYWQINENNIDCVLKLLQGAKPNSLFVIGNDSITIVDMLSTGSTVEYEAPFKISTINIADFYNDDDSNIAMKYESDSGNDYFWRDRSYIVFDHQQYVNNLTSSLKYSEYSGEFMRLTYKNSLMMNYELGSALKLGAGNLNSDEYFILGKIYELRNKTDDHEAGITTHVLIGRNDNQ